MRTELDIDTDGERVAAADDYLNYGPSLSDFVIHTKDDLSGYAP